MIAATGMAASQLRGVSPIKPYTASPQHFSTSVWLRGITMFFFDVPAKSIELVIDGKKVQMHPKRFKSGSIGWYLGGKHTIQGSNCQLSFSAVVVGTKTPDKLIEIESVDQLTLDDLPSQNGALEASEPSKGKKLRKAKKTP